jgi:tetratricopeptide (TPR) repeat protein
VEYPGARLVPPGLRATMNRTGSFLVIAVALALVAVWLHGRAGRHSIDHVASAGGAARTREEPRAAQRRPLQPAPLASPAGEAAHQPSPWVELNDEATLALAQGDLAGAVERFERCHAAEPTRAVFAGNLAEALVRLAKEEHDRGELAAAIGHLERAVELASGREDIEVLRSILERWRAEQELGRDDWTEGSSRFELSFDTDRDDILHHSHLVLEHLEESYEDLRRWFGSDPLAGKPPVRVVLYDPEDFDRLTGLGDWAGGVFDGVVRVSVADLNAGTAWQSVLVHELTHAFIQALAEEGVPGWLNEGLAQLLEERPGAVERLRSRLVAQELFSLETLQGSLASWEDTSAIGRAYAESLVFVAYVREAFGDEALRRMILGVAEGRSAAESFERWTSVPLSVAFDDWKASLRR